MRPSTIFSTVLCAVALPYIAIASSHTPPGRRHGELASRMAGEVTLHKRFSNTRFTFYKTGLGACGKVNNDGDFIVALNAAQFGSGYPGPNCFKRITISFGGKSTSAQIMDRCPGCPFGGLDLSPGLFAFFAPHSRGVISGSWSFGGGGGGGGDDDDDEPAPAPRPKPTPRPRPTTTRERPRPTPPPKPTTTHREEEEEEETTTRRRTTTSEAERESSTSQERTSTSTSSTAATSSTNSSAAAAAAPTPAAPTALNLLHMNQVMIAMGSMVISGKSQ